MGIARSTFYDAPASAADDTEILAKIAVICDEFESYGYRRVGAALRHQGIIVNSKKVRRLMRENGLQPKRRRRFIVTTHSDHDSPIFPNLVRDMTPDGPEPALGGRPDLHRDRSRLCLSGGDPGRLVAPGGRVCDQPIDRRADCGGGIEGGRPSASAATWLRSPFRSWFPICLRALPCASRRTRLGRFNGQAR
jgi:hypothetical protein